MESQTQSTINSINQLKFCYINTKLSDIKQDCAMLIDVTCKLQLMQYDNDTKTRQGKTTNFKNKNS